MSKFNVPLPSLGDDASMDDVFARYAGGGIRESGDFTNAVETRRTVRRLR